MSGLFLDVVIAEVVHPVVTGFVRPARTAEILKWRSIAWGSLGISLGVFALGTRLEEPFLVGLAFAAGAFAVGFSLISSASATVLHRRWEESQRVTARKRQETPLPADGVPK